MAFFNAALFFSTADIDDDDDDDAVVANIHSCGFSRGGVDDDDAIPTPTKERCNLFGEVVASFFCCLFDDIDDGIMSASDDARLTNMEDAPTLALLLTSSLSFLPRRFCILLRAANCFFLLVLAAVAAVDAALGTLLTPFFDDTDGDDDTTFCLLLTIITPRFAEEGCFGSIDDDNDKLELFSFFLFFLAYVFPMKVLLPATGVSTLSVMGERGSKLRRCNNVI